MKKILLILLFAPFLLKGQFPAPDSVYDGNGKIRYLMAGDTSTKFQSMINTLVSYVNDTLIEKAVDSIENALKTLDSTIYLPQGEKDYLAYMMYADSNSYTLTLHTGFDGVSLQIGLELYRLVRNMTGGELTDGKALRSIGSTGTTMNVDYAGCGSWDSSRVSGISTHTISANEYGFITTFGDVHGLSYSSEYLGDDMWLSYHGEIDTIIPYYPNQSVLIGQITKTHPTQAILTVCIQREILNHKTGSILFINGNREPASDSSIIKKENGQIKIDSLNADIFTNGVDNYTLADLAAGSSADIFDTIIVKDGNGDSIMIVQDFASGKIMSSGVLSLGGDLKTDLYTYGLDIEINIDGDQEYHFRKDAIVNGDDDTVAYKSYVRSIASSGSSGLTKPDIDTTRFDTLYSAKYQCDTLGMKGDTSGVMLVKRYAEKADFVPTRFVHGYTLYVELTDSGSIYLTPYGITDTVNKNTNVVANTAFRTTPSSVITAGTGIDWSGNTLNVTVSESSSSSGDTTYLYFNDTVFGVYLIQDYKPYNTDDNSDSIFIDTTGLNDNATIKIRACGTDSLKLYSQIPITFKYSTDTFDNSDTVLQEYWIQPTFGKRKLKAWKEDTMYITYNYLDSAVIKSDNNDSLILYFRDSTYFTSVNGWSVDSVNDGRNIPITAVYGNGTSTPAFKLSDSIRHAGVYYIDYDGRYDTHNEYDIALESFTDTTIANYLNGSVYTYCTQFQTVYDSWTNKPSAAHAMIFDTLMRMWVDSGFYARTDRFYAMITDVNTNGEALTNWMSPGTDDLTLYNTPTFTANEGITGNASNMYAGTNFNASTEGVHYTLDDATIITYLRSNVSDGNKYDIGCSDGTQQASISASYSGTSFTRMNAVGSLSFANSDESGCYISTRRTNLIIEYYRAGTSVAFGNSSASSSIPNLEMFLLARNLSGTANSHTDNQMSFAIFMDGVDDAEAAKINYILEYCMDRLGKGVQ